MRATFAAHIAVNVSRVARAAGRRGLTARSARPHCCRSRAATTAHAHPLGNFSVNHLTTVRISDDGCELRYLLDQAEIPTVQERGLSPKRSARAQARRGPARPGADRRRQAHRAGARGRSRGLLPARQRRPRHLALRVPADGRGRLAALGAPARRHLPRPRRLEGDRRRARRGHRRAHRRAERRPDQRPAPLSRGPPLQPARPPRRRLPRPARRRHPGRAAQRGRRVRRHGESREEGGFAGCSRAPPPARACSSSCSSPPSAGARCTRSRPATARRWWPPTWSAPADARDTRSILGATVTVTHTIGVFALGLVTLALSQYVLPEDLYPWLNLASGLLVVVIGAGVLRSRIRHAKRHHQHHHHDHQSPPPRTTTTSPSAASSAWAPPPASSPAPRRSSCCWPPSPSTRSALGMLLIVAFSLGLAAHPHRARPGRRLRAQARPAPAGCRGSPRPCPRVRPC